MAAVLKEFCPELGILFHVLGLTVLTLAVELRQHGQELMTLTMDVNQVALDECHVADTGSFRKSSLQAHTAVGGLRQELLPEIGQKIDERKVEEEFTQACYRVPVQVWIAGRGQYKNGQLAAKFAEGWLLFGCPATHQRLHGASCKVRQELKRLKADVLSQPQCGSSMWFSELKTKVFDDVPFQL